MRSRTKKRKSGAIRKSTNGCEEAVTQFDPSRGGKVFLHRKSPNASDSLSDPNLRWWRGAWRVPISSDGREEGEHTGEKPEGVVGFLGRRRSRVRNRER